MITWIIVGALLLAAAVVGGLAGAALVMLGRRAPQLRADLEELHQGGKVEP